MDGNAYYFAVLDPQNGQLLSTPVKFIFGKMNSGIEDIETEDVDADAAPEYFNLQGIRVAEPQAGQVYIVRRGAKTTKELVK